MSAYILYSCTYYTQTGTTWIFRNWKY